MDAFVTIAGLTAILVLLAALSLLVGTDSRDGFADGSRTRTAS